MTAQNPNQEIDTFRVTENEDGTFALEWHPDDPKWAWLNDLTQDQIQIIMEQAIQSFMEESKGE